MKQIFGIIMLALTIPVGAQQFIGALVNSGSGWTPWTAALNGGQTFSTPQQFALLCNAGAGWQACNPSTAGGVTFPAGFLFGNNSTSAPTGYSLGDDMTATTGTFLDSTGSRSFQFGYQAWGDSLSSFGGAQTVAAAYTSLINSEADPSAFGLTTRAVGGDAACDQSFRVLSLAAPTDTGNMVNTSMIGTNDTSSGLLAANQAVYAQCFMAANARLAMSSTNVANAQSTGPVTALYIAGGTMTGYVTNDTITYTCGTTNAVATVTAAAGVVTAIAAPSTVGAGCVPTNSSAVATSGAGAGLLVSAQTKPNIVRGGTWTTDATFASNPGLLSTVNGSTLTYANCYVSATGVAYVWAYATTVFNTSSFTFSIDGVAQTDSITGLTSVPTYIGVNGPHNIGTTTAILARYPGIAQGSHTCLVTANVPASASVGIIGIGFPPAIRNRGSTAPAVYIGGVTYQQNNANPTGTATYNAWAIADTNVLIGDGLATKFVDVRAAVDYNTDFNAEMQCPSPIAGTIGLHGNNCWHNKVANAFLDSIKPSVLLAAQTILGGASNQILYQSSSGVTGFLAKVNNAVVVTNGSGVPSESTTLPTGLALQTPASVNLTNGTALPLGGISGLGTGVATALANAVNATGGFVTYTAPNAVTSATGGSGTGAISCATATCTNLRGSYTVAGGTFATGTLLTLVWPTTTTANVCNGSVLNNATGASIGYHSVATATGMTFSSLTAATGLSIDIDYACQP